MREQIPATTSQDEYIRLRGGFDLLTPVLELKTGTAREMRNWECAITGGYSRIGGYERTDGRPNPSDAIFFTLTANVTGTIAVGNTIYGATSGALGVVIYRSGSLVAYTKAVGAFEAGENIHVPDALGAVQGTVTDTGGLEETPDWDARMRALAADVYRADILAVPGSGPIRGVLYLDGTLYAFRDNAGATALAIYRATVAGWVSVPLLSAVAFTAGLTPYTEGSTLTKGGVSATVRRVCLTSGSWAGSNAAGVLVVSGITGGSFSAGSATGTGSCTPSGAETSITLLPGGSVTHHIGTVEAQRAAYMVDGVNKAWEFDGEVVAPITTGNAVDTPDAVMVHAGHLFLSFGNSVQNSATGQPFNWTALNGAAEFLANSNVTAMRPLPGSQATPTAAICQDEGTQILYGSSAEDFQLVNYEDSAGARRNSVQSLGQLFMLDDRGIVSLSATQAYGNFAPSTISLHFRPWIQARRNLVTASLVNREKSQYRLFFSDGTGLYYTMANGKPFGAGPVEFPHVVRCACTGETPDGAETSFFGSDNGMVYRLDAGSSFDGEAIDHDIALVYANQGSPRHNKRYRRCTFEVQSDFFATFNVMFDLAYGSIEREQQDVADVVDVALGSVYWDGFTWDNFTWDGRSLAPNTIEIGGSGENLAVRVHGSSAICEPFTINSLIVTYSVRRRKRS